MGAIEIFVVPQGTEVEKIIQGGGWIKEGKLER